VNVPYFRASLGAEEKAAVAAVLDSGWLTTGNVTREFEAACAAFVGAPHAVAVNSCTAALHLALEAAGVRRDDIVLVPAMTFAATAEVVRYLDARPVLVDCDPVTLNVDPEAMAAAAATWAGRGRLAAMIPMHYGGQMADVERLGAIADAHGMRVIEDAAHAFPAFTRHDASSPWRSAGTTAPMTCFSFYANKCITTGEGGLLVTDDAAIAERARIMSLHGLSKSAWSRFESRGSWYYEILAPGFKYNLTDVAAAVGMVQLRRADAFWHARRRLAASYTERLAALAEWIETPVEVSDRQSSWHLYPVRLHLDRLRIDRAAVIDALKAAGITCSVHWMPLHLHPYYRELYGTTAAEFPVASAEWPRLVSLPLFPSMTDVEIEYVCATLGDVLERHATTRRASRAVS